MAVPPQLRGSLKAAAPAASSGGVSPSRVRNGYAVTHHRKQQLQEQQQERQLQQHNRAGEHFGEGLGGGEGSLIVPVVFH